VTKYLSAVACLLCLIWGAVVPQAAPSASGAKHTVPSFECWEHQGAAAVDFFGTKLTCTPCR
jgi:hypothetical protein